MTFQDFMSQDFKEKYKQTFKAGSVTQKGYGKFNRALSLLSSRFGIH